MESAPAREVLRDDALDVADVLEIRRVQPYADLLGLGHVVARLPDGIEHDVRGELDLPVNDPLGHEEQDLHDLVLVLFHDELPDLREFVDGPGQRIDERLDLLDGHLLALGLALLYNRPRRGVGVYRAIAYLPSVIPDAAYALVWLWIFNPLYGPLNAILNALGLPTPAWLLEYSLAKPALALMALFPIGEGFVILLAGLKNIPHELYDAAHVDGASRWQAFRRITLPVLTPWLMLLSIRDIILTFPEHAEVEAYRRELDLRGALQKLFAYPHPDFIGTVGDH